jgi:predicted nucleotidyltransferase
VTLKISPEKMAHYRATARRREEERQRQLAERHKRAWAVVKQAGSILKEQLGAERVVVFGSVCFPERFHERSDVDLAVWGIPEQNFYRAVSRLLDIDPTISVDLIEGEYASPNLLQVIEGEGKIL